MSTQWRSGFNGPIGLDYGVLPAVMRLCGIPPGQRNDVFADVRTMESAALDVIRAEK
jgi:hypothetical protein